MSIVLSFSGKIGSGKDYIIKNVVIPYLKQKRISYIVLSFATYLKQKLFTEYNKEYSKLYIEKDKDTRKLLQMVGDEMRQKDKDIFTKSMHVSILTSLEFYDVIIVSDTRFKNEKSFLEGLSFIPVYTLRINAPGRTLDKLKKENSGELKEHRSETELDEERFDLIVENDYHDKRMEITMGEFLDSLKIYRE